MDSSLESNIQEKLPSFQEIKEAQERISNHTHHTPLFSSLSIGKKLGLNFFAKAENLQKVGAFKARGATNAVLSLSQSDSTKGVLTHSSGNHAQALAFAAAVRGIPAYTVIPEDAPILKRNAAKEYGAKVVTSKRSFASRTSEAAKVKEETGAYFFHPFRDYRIIAGQGTIGLELVEDLSQIDAVVVPVGGGGMISGIATSLAELSPRTKVYGVEPETANDAQLSFGQKEVHTLENPSSIADGLLTPIGDINLAIMNKYVEDIVSVSDTEILEALKLILQQMKLLVEPSGAITLAALMSAKLSLKGQNVVAIFSGGNTDLSKILSKLSL